jgi:hypothetical protein
LVRRQRPDTTKPTFSCFLTIFAKDSHKYTYFGKISKYGP